MEPYNGDYTQSELEAMKAEATRVLRELRELDRKEINRLRAFIEKAENMLVNGEAYGHIAACLRGALQGRALDGEKM